MDEYTQNCYWVASFGRRRKVTKGLLKLEVTVAGLGTWRAELEQDKAHEGGGGGGGGSRSSSSSSCCYIGGRGELTCKLTPPLLLLYSTFKGRNKQTNRCCKLHKPLKGITLADQCHNQCPTLLFYLMAPEVLPQPGITFRPHVWYSRGASLGEAATLNQQPSHGGLGPRMLAACLHP